MRIIQGVVFLCVFVGVASAQETLSPDDFMVAYCSDCHDADMRKGKVNLDGFGVGVDLQLMFDVYDQVVLEQMPPEDKDQPSSIERQAFIDHLESLLAAEGFNRKLQPGYGNYVNHRLLFTPSDSKGSTPKRIWRVDPSAFAEIANKLIGKVVYRKQRQGVTKEHPSFNYGTPPHAFKDYASANYFEDTTTELVLGYAKDIVDFMYAERFRTQDLQAAKKQVKGTSFDRIGETYRLLFNRAITPTEREDLIGLDERSALVALILKVESIYRHEVRMDDYELTRAIGFALNESGPDAFLFKEIATRPLGDVLNERMKTEAFHARLLRFMREYFEYDKAPDVFKDPLDLPPVVVTRQDQYRPEWYVEDADEFCLRIIRRDQDVLRELLTSNVYSVKGELNSTHIKEPKRAESSFYHYGYHGNYGITEAQSGPWRQDWEMPNRLGMLHHPAWLISFSDNEKNQSIQRGRWVTTKLLGGFVPDTPIEVDAKLPDEPSMTLREKMHVTEAKECWVCHRHMNEQGYPFEQFDFLGRFRIEELRKPVVTTGRVKIPEANGIRTVDVADPYAYVRELADSHHVQQVFLRHLFRFFMGRNETLEDGNTLIAMDEAYGYEGSLKAAVKVLLLSDSYRIRR